MAYTPTTWECGDIITADALNKIENAIAEASEGNCSCDNIDAIIERTISGSYTNSCITDLGLCALHNCNLLTDVDLPNVTAIATLAFEANNTLRTATFSQALTIGEIAFEVCTALESVNFPNAVSIAQYAFGECDVLNFISFPNVIDIADSAFYLCPSIPSAIFPKAETIGGAAFGSCFGIEIISFPKAVTIGTWAFGDCSSLTSAYFLGSSVPTFGFEVFGGTPMETSALTGNFGSIYVPASLVSAYQAVPNLSSYASRITAYTE